MSQEFFKDLFDLITPQWSMASDTWFGETSRQSQVEPVKQHHTGISPNHVPEAVPYCVLLPATGEENAIVPPHIHRTWEGYFNPALYMSPTTSLF